jgi:hypothetical protein
MKVIIAGSRNIFHYPLLKSFVEEMVEKHKILTSEVVSGCANGVDSLGERWARENNIPIHRFPAGWEVYGRAAGHIRNGWMADYANMAIVLRHPDSVGSMDMVSQMKRRSKPVLERIIFE